MKVHSTSTTGHQVAYDLETGNGGSNYTGRVRLSGGGVLSLQNPIDSDRLTIDANGQVGLSATPNLGSSNANNTILTLKGKAAAYGGIIEMSNHGTNGNGQTLGAISYFDPAYAVTKNAEIEVLRESNNDDAKMVFKTKPTGGTLADRLTISSTGLATFSGGIVTSEKGIMSGSVVIADEGVTTITPTRSGGFLEVHANTDDGTTGLYPLSNYSTKIFFDSGSSPANAKITTAIGADVDLTTSDVTGTTGTNGKVTIATLSNAIKIENQKGGAVKFFYTITC